jgi:hypothetical protein
LSSEWIERTISLSSAANRSRCLRVQREHRRQGRSRGEGTPVEVGGENVEIERIQALFDERYLLGSHARIPPRAQTSRLSNRCSLG